MAKKSTKPAARPNWREAIVGTGSRQVNGLADFIREQGVVGLAIGFVIGASTATLMRSLVDNILMPPLGVLLGSGEGIKTMSLSMGTYQGKEALLRYGQFFNDFINFLILVLAIYLVFRILRLDRFNKKKE